MLLFSGSKKN